MRSKHLLLMLLLALMAPWAAMGQTQEQVTITCYPPTQEFATGYTDGTTKTSGEMHAVSDGGVQGWMKFDVSSIPDDATINSIKLYFYCTSTSNCYVKLTSAGQLDPVTATPSDLYSAITTADPNYCTSSYMSGFSSTGWKNFTLSSNAVNALQGNGLTNGYFTVGFYEYETGTYHLYAYGYDNADYKPYIEVTCTVTVSCPKPTNLQFVSATTSSATLSWTENGTADSWQICLNGDEEHLIDANSNPFTIPNLAAGTSYTAKVRAYCDDTNQSYWSDIENFVTECEARQALGYNENFDSYTAGDNVLPNCWSYINTSTNSTYKTFPKIINSSANSSPNCLQLRSNYKSSGDHNDPQDQYAIMPEMTGLSGKQITLMAKGYNASSTFFIGTMSDPADASTFEPIGDARTLTTSYQEFNIIVPTTTSSYLAIKIEAATSSRTNNGVYIDDITIAEQPTCIKPTGLEVTAAGQTATLTWTSDADQWQVAHATSATAVPNDNIVTTTPINTKPYSIENLALDEDHYFWVRTYCDATDQSDWVGPVSVHIGYCVPTLSSTTTYYYISRFTTTGASTNIDNETTGTGAAYSNYYDTHSASAYEGQTINFTITIAGGSTHGSAIWVDWNNDFDFDDDGERVHHTTSYASSPHSGSFTIPTGAALGDHRMRVVSDYSGSNPNDPCSASTGEFEDYKLTITEVPSCLPPSGLALSLTDHNITATWEGTATSYNIDINGTVTNNVTSPHAFAAELSTTYTVKVQANCPGNETSEWSNPASLTTPPCWGGHVIEYALADSYGDGWNGNAILLKDACNIIETITIASGASNSGTITLCDGDYYQLTWQTGSYPGETSFTLTVDGVTLYTNQSGSSLTDGQVLHTIGTEPDMLPKPTGLTAGTPEAHQVELSWTENGTATAWQIMLNDDEDNLVDANTNPFTLTGLTQETDYTVKVRAVSPTEQSCWSDEETFTTATACAKPTELTQTNITTTSATLSWDGSSDSYVLQYRPWYPAGDDVQPTGNVMTPANYDLSGFTGTGSVAIRHYNCYNQFALIVDDIVVKNADNEVVFSENFEECGGNMPAAFTNMDLDGDGYVWNIADNNFRVNGNYGLKSDSFDNDYGILYPDNWLIINNIPMGGTITFNYCAQDADWAAETFCVYVSTENSIVEVPVTGKTYAATGLEPNTPYAWQVKGICGGESSNWASSFFQTLNDVIVFQTAGNWNVAGNWDVNRVPTTDDKVQIDAAAVVPTGVIAYAKTTTMGTSGSITIQEGGQLKQGTANVDVTVEKSITAVGDDNWDNARSGYYFIASPVGTTLFASYSAGWGYAQNLISGDYDLYAFDPTLEDEWYNYKANTADFTRLYSRQGYLYASKSGANLQFIGTTPTKSLNNVVTEAFTYDATSSDEFNGWALVGNPFTCNAYLTFTPEGGATPQNVDFYVMNSTGSGFDLSATSVALNVCQGAFFYADANGTINYSSEAPAAPVDGILNMNLTQNNGKVDQARVRFGEGHNLKHMSFNQNSSKLYMPVEGNDYAVVYAEPQGEMPVSFKAEKNGSYTLSFSNENVEFGYLHLIDNMTGEDVNLLENPSYTFNATTTDYASRFKLVFSTGNGVNDESFAFISDGNIILNGEGMLQVVDVMGRIMMQEENATSVSTSGMTPGVYVLRLINGDSVRTQKIVIK